MTPAEDNTARIVNPSQEPKTITESDITHLEWIYDRLVYVHGENPNYDYMRRLKQIFTSQP